MIHMNLEDETQPLPPDERLDATLRVIVTGVLLLGGGFFLLEFVHWLANGGLRPFLIGLFSLAAFFLILVLWSQLLASGGRQLRGRPLLYSFLGLLTVAGLIAQHFAAA